jgi:hypothetical protein
MSEPSLSEIAAEIELLETAESFGSEVQQFTDWLSTLSGGDVETWLARDGLKDGRPDNVDKTIEYELGKLKDAAFEFSETLSGFADNFKPLTDAASTADDVNTVVQAVSSLSTMIGRADEAVGAQKATELANVVSSIKDVSTLLTGLSLNPVIGVFIGLYATALQDAAIGLEKIDAYAARRNEIIASRGGEVDCAAIEEQRAAQAESAEARRAALAQRLGELYQLRGEAIARFQETVYLAAGNDCARTRQAELKKLILIAYPEGGVVKNAPTNGETLRALESWVEGINSAAAELFVEASVTPEGPARQQIIDRLDRMTEARRRVVSGLRPFRDCVRQRLERYGTSTGDDVGFGVAGGAGGAGAAAANAGGGNRRMALIGGGVGLFAVAALGLGLLFGGSEDDPISTGSGSSGGGAAVSSSTPANSGGSSGLTEAPVVVNACDVFSAERISTLFGAPGLIASPDGNGRREICTYRTADAAGGIHVEVQRNSAADGFLDEFRRQRPDASVEPVDWRENGELLPGELRVFDGGQAASFWAYVITDDPLGRDVFIWIGNVDGSLTESIWTVANELRLAILEANGRSPES